MTIEVYGPGHLPILLALPTWLAQRLLHSRRLARLLQALRAQEGQDKKPMPSAQALHRLCSGLGHSLCRFKGLVLLEVQSANGERVKITL